MASPLAGSAGNIEFPLPRVGSAAPVALDVEDAPRRPARSRGYS